MVDNFDAKEVDSLYYYVWINSLDSWLPKCGPWALFRESVEQAH